MDTCGGTQHRRVRQVAGEGVEQRVAAGQIATAHLAQMAVVAAGGQQLRERDLVHHRAAGVGQAFDRA